MELFVCVRAGTFSITPTAVNFIEQWWLELMPRQHVAVHTEYEPMISSENKEQQRSVATQDYLMLCAYCLCTEYFILLLDSIKQNLKCVELFLQFSLR